MKENPIEVKEHGNETSIFHIASIRCEVPANQEGYTFLGEKLNEIRNILQ